LAAPTYDIWQITILNEGNIGKYTRLKKIHFRAIVSMNHSKCPPIDVEHDDKGIKFEKDIRA